MKSFGHNIPPLYLLGGLEHVPQRDDVLVLAVPQQDLDLLHAVPLPLVDYLDGVLLQRGPIK